MLKTISKLRSFTNSFDWLIRNEEQREAKRGWKVREALKTTLVAYDRQSSTSVSGIWHEINKGEGMVLWLRKVFM